MNTLSDAASTPETVACGAHEFEVDMRVRFRRDYIMDIPGVPGHLKIPAGTVVRVTQLDTPPRYREPEVRLEVPLGVALLCFWLPESFLEQVPLGAL